MVLEQFRNIIDSPCHKDNHVFGMVGGDNLGVEVGAVIHSLGNELNRSITVSIGECNLSWKE